MTAPIRWSDIADLYREFHPRLYAYIYRRLCQPGASGEMAEDFTSEVFLKAIEAMCSGHGPESSVSGWLFRIAHNLVVDEHKRRSRRGPSIDFDELADVMYDNLTPHEYALSTLGCETINSCIAQLSDEQAQTVMLTVEGCAAYDLGDAVGAGENAAKARLQRGRVRLKQLFEQRGYA